MSILIFFIGPLLNFMFMWVIRLMHGATDLHYDRIQVRKMQAQLVKPCRGCLLSRGGLWLRYGILRTDRKHRCVVSSACCIKLTLDCG